MLRIVIAVNDHAAAQRMRLLNACTTILKDVVISENIQVPKHNRVVNKTVMVYFVIAFVVFLWPIQN